MKSLEFKIGVGVALLYWLVLVAATCWAMTQNSDGSLALIIPMILALPGSLLGVTLGLPGILIGVGLQGFLLGRIAYSLTRFWTRSNTTEKPTESHLTPTEQVV